MLVTNVVQQRKDPSRYSVFIDGAYRFSLPQQDILYFKIKAGEPLAQETCEYIEDHLLYIQAQEVALHFLGYKMRTEKEVREKLQQKGYDESMCERVLCFLKKYAYVDDLAYAKAYIKERSRLSARSVRALQWELKCRGIAQSVIDEALEQVPVNEYEDAVKWIRKKQKGNLSEMKEEQKRKLWGFLQRRGYGYDVIEYAFSQAESEG